MSTIVTLTLFRFSGLRAKVWAFSQMGLSRGAFAALPGLRFLKLMGTGAGAGFSTTPDFSVYAWLAVWDDEAKARDAIENSQVMTRYRAHCDEVMTMFLEPTRSRGRWSDTEPFSCEVFAEPSGPIVALTRATLSPLKAAAFWARVPAISAEVERETHQGFMMGMGEVPWLHQVTFSIWTNEEAMRRFSLTSATHGEAVKLAFANGWFREYLFARFNLVDTIGQWTGFDPALISDVSTHAQAAE